MGISFLGFFIFGLANAQFCSSVYQQYRLQNYSYLYATKLQANSLQKITNVIL